jgi:hypothetical protein
MRILLLSMIFSLQLFAASDAFVALGERLFLDDRFSEFFFKSSLGDVNYQLQNGSSDLETIDIFGTQYPSPFKGQAKSCGACHMIDQALDDHGLRAYNDFSKRAVIPTRDDGKTHTLRNTPMLVGIGSPYNQNRISHWDGEFFDHSQTVLGNFTGRNMGWKSSDKKMALKNIVNVIRFDNGAGVLAQDFGGSYKKILLGTARSIPEDFRLEMNERLNVDKASDKEIIDTVIAAVTAYMNDLDFSMDSKGRYNGSPYDQFLIANGIDTVPAQGESIFSYRHRIRREFFELKNPKWIKKKYFEIYKKEIGFEVEEFEGLKIFFNLAGNSRGMCIACHVPPLFSDQFFYNIGTTQLAYDEVHGIGAINDLVVPNLNDRGDKYYLDRVDMKDPSKVDLGLWNFYGRKPIVTNIINQRMCRDPQNCDEKEVLEAAQLRVKVPTLRLLGLTAPYFHDGSKRSIRETLTHYRDIKNKSDKVHFRNLDHRMNNISLNQSDIIYLEKFLSALNEHYE